MLKNQGLIPPAGRGDPISTGDTIHEKDGVNISDSTRSPAEPVGVQGVDAASASPRGPIYITYAGILVLSLCVALQSSVVGSLAPYVTSAFAAHSLIPVTNLLAFIINGVVQLPLSRIIDMYGRMRGLMAMALLDTLGLIIMATSRNVKAYAGAQILLELGFGGILYILRVLVIDISPLRNRALLFALTSYPYLITPFAGPAMAQAYYEKSNWRWAFGTFAFILPFLTGLLILLFLAVRKRSHQTVGYATQDTASVGSAFQRIRHHIVYLDFVGVLLACASLILILLPLSLSTSEINGWKSPSTISMLVIGVCCLLALVIYERFFVQKRFLSFELLRERKIWGACLAIGGEYLSLFCWFSYFSSVVQVVHGLNIKDAGYLMNTYYLGQAVISALTGLLLKYTSRYRTIAAVGFAINTLATGVFIYCSRPDSSFGGVVGCQILVSISAGILQVTLFMAGLDDRKDEIAMRMALFFLFSMVGAAIGSTVATPMWRSRFLHLLEEGLPADLKSEASLIFSSIELQLSYAAGTPGREAIIKAMLGTWRHLMITATAVLALGWAGALLLKDQKHRK